MKKVKFISLILAVALVLLCGCARSEGEKIDVTPELDAAVSAAIIECNTDTHFEGKCKGEGHKIFEVEKKDNEVIVYAYIGYSEYDYENGEFIAVSGVSAPAVIRFDNEYKLLELKYPEDGDEYEKSIRKMFPKSCVSKALNPSESDIKDIQNQLQRYADEYLELVKG